MPAFDYIVRNEKGARKTGSISADNYNKAIEKLQNELISEREFQKIQNQMEKVLYLWLASAIRANRPSIGNNS